MLIFADGGAVLIVHLCIFFGIQQGFYALRLGLFGFFFFQKQFHTVQKRGLVFPESPLCIEIVPVVLPKLLDRLFIHALFTQDLLFLCFPLVPSIFFFCFIVSHLCFPPI